MESKISIDSDKIELFCQKWNILELSFFGSVLRDDFGPDSDVDVLVKFAPNDGWSVFDFMRAETELSGIVGRKVDLIEKSAIERYENRVRRDHILSHARSFYVAR